MPFLFTEVETEAATCFILELIILRHKDTSFCISSTRTQYKRKEKKSPIIFYSSLELRKSYKKSKFLITIPLSMMFPAILYQCDAESHFFRKTISFAVVRDFRLSKWRLVLYWLYPSASLPCLILKIGKEEEHGGKAQNPQHSPHRSSGYLH